MLRGFKALTGLSIETTDGEVGKVKDIYFDDHQWVVRYLIVETGSWLAGRKVLISPVALQSIDWDNHTAQVNSTRQQVRASPKLDTDKPVSRQHERDFFDHYRYPYYWSGPGIWGTASYPISPVGFMPPITNSPGTQGEKLPDPCLRSASEVTDYRLQTTDDSMGHVEDFLFEPESWAIRYLEVDTRNWFPGRHVVIPPQWIKSVDWSERVVNVDVTRETVQKAPEYQPTVEFSRTHETDLHRYYQRRGYWQ